MSDQLEQRVAAIEERNQRVELDKAWEASWVRRITIAVTTYLIVVAYSCALDAPNPLLNAVVPTAGFLLSTLTVPAVKRLWTKRRID